MLMSSNDLKLCGISFTLDIIMLLLGKWVQIFWELNFLGRLQSRSLNFSILNLQALPFARLSLFSVWEDGNGLLSKTSLIPVACFYDIPDQFYARLFPFPSSHICMSCFSWLSSSLATNRLSLSTGRL